MTRPRLPRAQLGQVFATKSDVLPPQYPRKLKALYDSCPASPFWRIKRTLEKELGAPGSSVLGSRTARVPRTRARVSFCTEKVDSSASGRPLEELFAKFEPEALATATIAQARPAPPPPACQVVTG